MKNAFVTICMALIAQPGYGQGIPTNASPNSFSKGWTCNKGYFRQGNECLVVKPPPNAGLNYLGNGWQCNEGFHRSGNECRRVVPPENAKLNYLKNGWECIRGYYKSGTSCTEVILPDNAALNYLGNGWECNRGYYRSNRSCQRVRIPSNAKLNYFGNAWECNDGFKKSAQTCSQMTPTELRRRDEQISAARVASQRRRAAVLSGDSCEVEYKTNANVCVAVSNSNIDCNEAFGDSYFRDCEVSIEYELATDYSGGSYLEVEVECEVEIEYKGRDSNIARSD
jgi:hypothetical protein